MNGAKTLNQLHVRTMVVTLAAMLASGMILGSADAQGRNGGRDSGSSGSDRGSSRSDSGSSRSESRSSGSSSRDSGSSRSDSRSSDSRSSGPSRDSGSSSSGRSSSGSGYNRDSGSSAPSRSSSGYTRDSSSSGSGSSYSRDSSAGRTSSGYTRDSTSSGSGSSYSRDSSVGRTQTPSRDTTSRSDTRTPETRTSYPTRDSSNRDSTNRDTPVRDSRSSGSQDVGRSDTARGGSVTDRSSGRTPSDSSSRNGGFQGSNSDRRGSVGSDNGAFHSAPALPGNDRSATNRTAGGRDFGSSPNRNRSYDLFTRSNEGRTFNNGVVLRSASYYPNRTFVNYFPGSYAYYPHYCSTWDVNLSFYSPYSYYGCAPYIYRRNCEYRSPVSIWIDIPIYDGGYCHGYDQGYDRNDDDDYYLRRRSYSSDSSEPRDADLERATEALRDSFRLNNINTLAELVDPNVKISIFRKGKYEYSLNSNDYLDMTRDMLKSTETITIDLYRFHKRANGVMVISGKHVYLDRDNRERTVYVSFVMERIGGRWTLTQAGTAPDRIDEPR